MRNHAFLISTVAIAGIAFGCASKSSDSGSAGAAGMAGSGTAGAGGGTSGSGGDGTAGGTAGSGTAGSGTAGSGAAGSSGSGGSGTAGGGTAGGGTAVTSCSTGVVIAGDPLWDDPQNTGASAKPAGQALKADPPPEMNYPTFVGNRLFVDSQFEIWTADMSAATPMISRIAGNKSDQQLLADTTCAATRFIVTSGLAARPDGTLVTVDTLGGAVVEITDPGGSNCMSHYVAGTHVQSPDTGTSDPVNPGDVVDVPGSMAKFYGVQKIAIDPSSNIYVFDQGNAKIKKIANDAMRTVTTVTTITNSDDTLNALSFLNGKLYGVGVDGSNDFFWEIDVNTPWDSANPKKNLKEVFREPNHFTDLQGQGVPTTLVPNGNAFFVSSWTGYIWSMGVDGTVLDTLAGTGTAIDFGTFDPTVSHPAKDWVLANGFSSLDGPWMTAKDGAVYWSGGFGIGNYMVKFSCP